MSQVAGRITKFALKDIVEVSWVDSCTRDRWDSRENYEKYTRPILCKSVGYLLKKNKREVAVIQSLTEDEGMDAAMTIPRSCVTKLRKLR